MPQPKKGPRLGSNPSHQRLMLANLAGSLFEHERIRTTEAKAKMLRPYAEKLISKAKKGDVHNRRLVLSALQDRDVVHKLFTEIAPRFADRNGGYTRILKIGPRQGDAAPMAVVELVEEGAVTRVVATEGEAPRRRIPRPRRRQDKPARSKAAEAAAAGTGGDEVESPPSEEAESAEAEAAADAASVEAHAEPEAEPQTQPGADRKNASAKGERGD